MLGVVLSGHPHPLTLGSLGLRSAEVSQDDVPVEVSLVHIVGGGIEVRPSAHDPLTLPVLALLPDVDLIFPNLGIEGNHRELCKT